MNDHPEGWNGAPRVDEHSVVRWATGTPRRLLADGPRGKWRIADNVDKDLGDWLIARCEGRAVAPPGAEPDLSALALRLAPDGDDAMTARLAFQDVVDAFHQTAPDNSYWRSVLEDWLVGASRREEPPAP